MRTNEASAINNDVDLVIISVRQASVKHTAAIEDAVVLFSRVTRSKLVNYIRIRSELMNTVLL